MARTESILNDEEISLVAALDALAVSGASQAIRKSGATTLANVAIASVGTAVYEETPSGSITGTDGTDGNATFTLANIPTSGTLGLYKSGQRMRAGVANDYTLSGLTITFNSGAIPVVGDWITADYTYN